MPVGGIVSLTNDSSVNVNLIRQSSLDNSLKMTTGQGIITGENVLLNHQGIHQKAGGQGIISSPEIGRDRSHGELNGGQAVMNSTENLRKYGQKINMEAYQAYYNTNESMQGNNKNNQHSLSIDSNHE